MTKNNMTLKTNSKELRSTLWEAANILRGSAVDRTDWKGYILPLIFFKRISDVWDEEQERMAKEYGDVYADEHRFLIPNGCHWNDIRSTTQNVGAALKHAMQEVERANPSTLYRVFGGGDWGNKEKFSDELMKDLFEGFSVIKLGNNSIDTDILGDAYEYLIGEFADITRRKKAGEFYTPRPVVRLMTEILSPNEGESIYDPTCGTGGMLLAAIDHVKRNGGDQRTFFGKIYGQEKNLTTSSVARMNLLLHGIEDFQIAREDTLRCPAFTDNRGGLSTFDCVIANPPFSLKEWGTEIWENDPWERNKYGLPPDSYADFAFVQHMIASMNKSQNGRMAVVLPQGTLFRKHAESKIRQSIIVEDLIETIIGLPANLFYGTTLAGCIIIFKQQKSADRKNKILFIDAQNLYRKGRAQNFLDSEHCSEILKAQKAFDDIDFFSRVVSLNEIKEKNWTLKISTYVKTADDEEVLPVKKSFDSLNRILHQLKNAEDSLKDTLIKGDWLE